MKYIVVLCSLYLTLHFLYGHSNINVIEDPTPKYAGYYNKKILKLSRQVEKIEDQYLKVFAGIKSAATDRDGNFYLFDYKHSKIIKLNPDFNFITSFGSKGEGPGKFKFFGHSNLIINVGHDKFLYVSNIEKRKIIKFSLIGKFIEEFSSEHFNPIKVVVDEKGEFYLPSLKNSLIDIHNPQMIEKKSILSRDNLHSYLFVKPPACVLYSNDIPYFNNQYHAILSTKDLLIINQTDLSIKIIDKTKGIIKRQFFAWDDYILSEYKIKISNALKKAKNHGLCGYAFAFSSCFINKEDNVFLQFADSHGEIYIYNFSISGKLNDVYHVTNEEIEFPIFFHEAHNNLYAYNSYSLLVFSEKK